MNNIKNNISKNFTTVPNALIKDIKLTDRARFLYVYLASKPDNWTFYNKELSKSLKYTIKTLRKHIDEITHSGWVTKIPQSKINGRFTANTYIINFSPDENLPCDPFVDTEKKPHDKLSPRKKYVTEKKGKEKKDTLNNKDLHKKVITQKSNLTEGIKIFK